MRALLGLGSNLGDRWSQLSDAIDALIEGDPAAVVSPIYETAPVGGPGGQGPYLNCVVSIETALAPRELLAMCQALEAAAKRVRTERFGPRTLDVDVLLIEGYTSDAPELTVPHPRMAERAFVLAPLSDIAPELVAPDWRDALGGAEAVRAAARRVGAYVREVPSPVSGLEVIPTVERLLARLGAEQRADRRIGLVPTMGALHRGHVSLIEAAAERDDVVAVSIFVNPLQFNRAEDLARYPRDLEADLKLAESAGATCCFVPSTDEMYPAGSPTVTVDPGPLGAALEGAFRPGHFSGVATVVAKLFALFSPHHAYFGEKDYQQLIVIRRMGQDLSFPVEVVACPTVREPDGLALSSRNRLLDPAARRAATVLSRALEAGATLVGLGRAEPEAVEAAMAEVVRAEPLAALEYAAVRSGVDLAPVERLAGPLRLLIAANLGDVRLIDNLAASV